VQDSAHKSTSVTPLDTSKEHWSDPYGRKAPNVLTLLRFMVIPIFVWLLVSPSPNERVWAAGLFILASFTDWLDGYIARLYKAETDFGKLLDPLADKVLVMAALVMLVAIPEEPSVSPWIVVVLLAREMIVNGLRGLAAVRGTVVSSSRWAKHKTFWMMVAIAGLLIRETYPIFGFPFNFYEGGMFFLWISLVLSLVTGMDYSIKLRKIWLDDF
jgi:CDP-diacylglycerol--glycerol-3-phosphate 3-phosphatidyltransferase